MELTEAIIHVAVPDRKFGSRSRPQQQNREQEKGMPLHGNNIAHAPAGRTASGNGNRTPSGHGTPRFKPWIDGASRSTEPSTRNQTTTLQPAQGPWLKC